MAIAEVQKIQLIAPSEAKMDILSSIQEEGFIQIESFDFADLGLKSNSLGVAPLEHLLHRLSHALTYLSLWEDKGAIKKLFTQKPQLLRQKREEVLTDDYIPVLDKIEELESIKDEVVSEIRFLEKEKEFLSPLEGFELPIDSVRPTDSTEVLIGILPFSNYEDFKKIAEEGDLWYEVINQGKRSLYVFLVYLSKEKEYYEKAFRDLNFSPLYFTEPILKRAEKQGKVNDVMEKMKNEIREKRQELDALEERGKSFLIHREKLMLVYDVLHNEREKILSSQLLGETERVFYMEGWICSAEIEKLKSKLQPYLNVVELYFRPALPDEDPPIVLENPKAGKPFEVITKLYGLPRRGSFDPTLALAPFFFVFVGLTVSEAGYGLLVALLSFLYIKYAKPKGGLLQFLKLLAILGISTVILGTLVGGWFGFPIRKLMILDPLKDPVSFLLLSLALGFIQVWFGTLLNMINGIKNKIYLQSIFVQGGWLLLLPSLVLYLNPQTKQSIWGICALLGAGGIVLFASPSRNPLARFFGGLYNLYDISRYVADILSYSRLLALGLATSVIAMVVNTLCQTAIKIPWLGWLFASLIFIGGHLFNLGISFLGGFVHSMRLQFVEFFSKFFKSGGRPFRPFELEEKFIEFI